MRSAKIAAAMLAATVSFAAFSAHAAGNLNVICSADQEVCDLMKGLFDAIYASSDLAGFCYTQFTDTMQETNGLLDENRQPKLPVDKLRDIIWQPSRAVPSEYLDIERQKALRTSSGQVV